MVKFRVLFFFLFSLQSILLHVQSSPVNTLSNSSSPSGTAPFNITIGSSITAASTNETSFWLSPSGVFAFGFYTLCDSCDRYKVGLWINKPSTKIVVWTANIDDDIPINHASSILLHHDGVFMLRSQGIIVDSLFGVMSEVASYALMQNNGNFVVYNSNSSVIWQSFDHPSHTILGGQTLKSGFRLVQNNGYELVMQKKGNLRLQSCGHHKDPAYNCRSYDWQSGTRKKNSKIELNLDMTGRLYLVDSLDGLVIKNFTKGEEHRHNDTSTIYRAELGSDGVFRLYAGRIDQSDSEQSLLLWHSHSKKLSVAEWTVLIFVAVLGSVAIVLRIIISIKNLE